MEELGRLEARIDALERLVERPELGRLEASVDRQTALRASAAWRRLALESLRRADADPDVRALAFLRLGLARVAFDGDGTAFVELGDSVRRALESDPAGLDPDLVGTWERRGAALGAFARAVESTREGERLDARLRRTLGELRAALDGDERDARGAWAREPDAGVRALVGDGPVDPGTLRARALGAAPAPAGRRIAAVVDELGRRLDGAASADTAGRLLELTGAGVEAADLLGPAVGRDGLWGALASTAERLLEPADRAGAESALVALARFGAVAALSDRVGEAGGDASAVRGAVVERAREWASWGDRASDLPGRLARGAPAVAIALRRAAERHRDVGGADLRNMYERRGLRRTLAACDEAERAAIAASARAIADPRLASDPGVVATLARATATPATTSTAPSARRGWPTSCVRSAPATPAPCGPRSTSSVCAGSWATTTGAPRRCGCSARSGGVWAAARAPEGEAMVRRADPLIAELVRGAFRPAAARVRARTGPGGSAPRRARRDPGLPRAEAAVLRNVALSRAIVEHAWLMDGSAGSRLGAWAAIALDPEGLAACREEGRRALRRAIDAVSVGEHDAAEGALEAWRGGVAASRLLGLLSRESAGRPGWPTPAAGAVGAAMKALAHPAPPDALLGEYRAELAAFGVWQLELGAALRRGDRTAAGAAFDYLSRLGADLAGAVAAP